jgi:glutathione S-transferase
MKKQAISLAYWDTRGLAQSIRFVLEYVDAEYDERRYQIKESDSGWDMSDWLDVKGSLGLLLPNLPYLIDGSLRITETTSILRYLDRRFELLPPDSDLQARSDTLMSATQSCFDKFILMCYSPDISSMVAEYEDWLATFLSRIDEALENLWFCHESPTSVDFQIYEMLFQNKEFCLEKILQFPKLMYFMEQVENLEPISNYRHSSRYIDYPINNRPAKFGNEMVRPAAEH